MCCHSPCLTLEAVVLEETPAIRACRRLTVPACSAIVRRKLGGISFPMPLSMQAGADIPVTLARVSD